MKLVNIHLSIIILLLISIHPVMAQEATHLPQASEWSLGQCLDTARAYNKNLKIKQNDIAIQSEKKLEAAAQRLPKLNVNGEYKYFTNLPYQLMPMSIFGGPEGQFKEAQFGVPHNINANIQLALPLYQPQIRHGISLTQTAIELHELQYQKTEEQLFFDISNLYYNAQILYQQSEFIEGNLENANKLLKIMQLLHEYQMAIGTDVSKVKLQISQLNTQKSLIQSQTEQVLNALKLAMGIPQDSPLSIEREIIPHEAIAYPHHASLDHLLAQKQGQRLQIELQQLKDSRLPTVSLFGSFGATGYGYDKKPNSFLNIYPIGFAGLHIHYPLFDGTITKRKINQKNIELTNNQLQMNLIKDQNSMLIENAILQRQITLNAIDEVKDQISQALSVYNQTVQQHQQDIATMADILQADNIVRTAQQSYLSAIVDFLKADLELRKLTGNFLNVSNQ